jgi:hypothetical protein
MALRFLLECFVPSIIICLTLGGCVSTTSMRTTLDEARESVRCEGNVVVSRDGARLAYRGDLTEQGMEVMKRLSEGRAISSLTVTSSGGEINVGMDFGDWVFDHGLSVIVEDYCLSSCANYIFTAAWQKVIAPGARVAWHGSARQKDLPDQLARLVDNQVKALALGSDASDKERETRRRAVSNYLEKSIARQDAFFERIGVSEFVTRVGSERYGIKGFYYLSPRDMASFGILNVAAPEDYAASPHVTLGSSPGIHVVHLILDK